MDVDHDLVLVEEFDALAVQVRGPDSSPATCGSGREKYPAKTHARKVAKQLGAKVGLIFLPGLPSQHFEDSDMAPTFRQRRYFYYVSGVDFPDAAVTYDIATDELVLWIPYLEPRQALYLGDVPSREECLARYDVDDCCYAAFMERSISRHLASHPGTVLYVLHQDQAPRLDRHRAMLGIDHGRLQPAMDAARVTKTPYEIRAIRRANAVSSAAHRRVLTRLRSLATEAEIEAVFVAYCLAHGAKRQAYPVIAGSGPNAATLHYDANDEPLEGRQLVVLDAGAEWNLYASDITRTLPVGGRFTAEGAAVYAAVDRMQRAAIDLVRPGCPYRGLQAAAQRVAVEELLALGILAGAAAEDVLRSGVVAAFFPHGLGHHVGLEVHDVWSSRLLRASHFDDPFAMSIRARGKRTLVGPEFCAALARSSVAGGGPDEPVEAGRLLVENMVVTIEPGIYFNRAFINAFMEDEPERAKFIDREMLERYYPVGGVRIEDDILVTKHGYEILSTAPKGEEALRIINGDYFVAG